MKTCTFTAEQEIATRIALEKRMEWLEHNIQICEKLKLPAFSDSMKIFQNAYGETLSTLNVLNTPNFIPKMHPDEEMTF